MPSFTAFFVATLVAWLVQRMLPAMPIAGLIWIVTFYFVRRWLGELRPV